VVNVVAVLLILISVVPIWLAQRLSEGMVRGGPGRRPLRVIAWLERRTDLSISHAGAKPGGVSIWSLTTHSAPRPWQLPRTRPHREEKVAATEHAEPTRAGLHRRTLAPSAVE
jgi:hypothetical protein